MALIDFAGFKDIVDALGGVTIDNPTKIISNEFEGYEWRFGRGTLHLDGRHALAYARVRKNQLDAGDTDVTRGERQQRVMNAIASGLAKPSTLLHLPTVADAVPGPLTTDLKARQLLALGWRKQRASRELHCRLGGTPALGSYLIGSEENRQVVAMVLGRSAPQPPRKGDPFARLHRLLERGSGRAPGQSEDDEEEDGFESPLVLLLPPPSEEDEPEDAAFSVEGASLESPLPSPSRRLPPRP